MVELGSDNLNGEMLRLNGSLDDFASVALRHADISTPLHPPELTPVSLVPSQSPKGPLESDEGRIRQRENSRRSIHDVNQSIIESRELSDSRHDDSYFGTRNWGEPVDIVSPSVFGHSSASILDEYTNDPRFVESQREFRSLLFETAHSLAPSRATSPVPATSNADLSVGISNFSDQPTYISQIINTARRVAYLKNYINEVAPWLDMFDAKQCFGHEVPVLARSSEPLVYAILAISARQMERARKVRDVNDSLELYQNSIRSLTPQLEARDPNIMATCVILCCLEMMSAAPKDWRRHLDGCAALFSSYTIHGFSGGLLQGVFWCYARMDLCAAIISEGEQSLVLPIENWLPPKFTSDEAGTLFQASGIPDMHANYAVYLCARVSHLIWTQSDESEERLGSLASEPFLHRWHSLWSELQQWVKDRPPELVEIKLSDEPTGGSRSLFPHILYAVSCAISSNQLYHTACLLMLDIKPDNISSATLGPASSRLWHARRICGISMTNEHHGCLNNAIQPLWVAGKLLSHPDEHRAIVNLMENIEQKTGWGTMWRVKDLKEIWGYDRNAPI